MKILLTNYSLELLAGTETWTMTMYKYLSKFHQVDVFVPPTGRNDLLQADWDSSKHYDLALINHNICLEQVRTWDIDKRVFTSHGVIPRLEKPVKGADIYVAVSEEVQNSLSVLGFDSVIIRNPIDVDHFTPSPVNQELKNILFLNNKADPFHLVEKACAGHIFKALSGHKSDVWESISWADLVISSGRGCYEALSCGKNVIIVNRFGCDGIVTWDNIEELRKNNCSGRRYRYNWTVENLRVEFDRYNPERNMRPYIWKNNNINLIAKEYLAL